MVSRFSKLSALTWDERQLLALAALLLPLTWLALKLRGLSHLHARLSALPASRSESSGDLAPDRMGYLVNAAASHSLFPASCLTRSLLLAWLLQRRGVSSRLRIGVRKAGDALDAHAWVECEGRPVNDAPDVAERFTPFDGPLSPGSFTAP